MLVDSLREVSIGGALAPPTLAVAIDSGLTLLFATPAPATPDLLFQNDEGEVIPRVDIEVTGTIPGPAVSIRVDAFVKTIVSFDIPGPTVSGVVKYISNTSRPTVSSRSVSHQGAVAAPAGTESGQQATSSSPSSWDAFWRRAVGLQPGVEHRLPDVLQPSPVKIKVQHQDAARTHTGSRSASQQADRSMRQVLASAFEAAAAERFATQFRHQDANRGSRPSQMALWDVARLLPKVFDASFQPAVPLPKGRSARYQEAVPPPIGITPGPVRPVTPVHPLSNDLLFCAGSGPSSPFLVFRADYCEIDQGGIVVPVRKVYIVINSATLYRASDNALVPTFGLSLSLDVGSWTWGFDAQLPIQAQSLVEPVDGPVELRAVINGTEFRLLAENLSRERTFGSQGLRVSGRGRNAILDAPYAPVVSYANANACTAAQIAGDILTFNGVSVGWGVEWGLTDWLVPAGVFSHQGTHISALTSVVQAAGGYLQPHKTANTLRVLPLYPKAPWEWGSLTPDFTLPADVTTRESIQWVEKPAYSRVYVSGQQAGVLGRVTRAGTAGDLLAPMVVDPLITHADAARQRGLAVLSDTGRIATVGLSLPILAETGIIEPGKFVRYVDGASARIGLVRSTNISVGETAVETRQQIVLETHE